MRWFCLFLFATAAAAQPFDYRMEAFAGRGHPTDGTPALDARFRNVRCVTVGRDGLPYVCTVNNGGLFRIEPDRTVTRLFGSEVSGVSVFGIRDAGDGGPALEAQGSVSDALVDSAGVVFFTSAHRIRRIGLDGVVTSIAGASESGFAGDGGPAEDALLRSPQNLAFGPDGSIYFSDLGNDRIRRIDQAGVITTVAGRGRFQPGAPARFEDSIPALEASLVQPRGLDVAANGDVYFCDGGTRRIRRVSAETGVITTVAGTGAVGPFGLEGAPAVETELDLPMDVLLDPMSGFLIAEGPRIRLVRDGIITTLIDDAREPFGEAVAPPRSLDWDADGRLLFAVNSVIRRREANGALTTVAGRPRFLPDERRLEDMGLYFPNTVQLAPDGAAVIVDSFNQAIWKVDGPEAEIIAGNGLFGEAAEADFALNVPLARTRDAAYDSDGALYLTEWLNHWVRIVRPDGTTRIFAGMGVAGLAGDGGPAERARLFLPRGLAIDADDNVYVADTGNELIRRIDGETGVISTFAGQELAGFTGDGGPAINAQFSSPRGLDFDPDGNLYIADTLNHRIRRIAPDGTISTFAGNGEKGHSGDGGPATEAALNEPHRIEFDADGYAYIGDSYNHVIRMVTPQGTIHTIAGSPLDPGDEGDGGPALAAKLNLPKGLAIRPNGDVLLSDNDNHRIRLLRPRPALSEGGVVNAASFRPTVAPDSIVTAFGTNLAGESASAVETPLPERLSYSRITVVDSAGAEHAVGQFFASKTQSNFHLPAGVALGEATLRLARDNGFQTEVALEVAASAAGLFEPAAYLRVLADGTRESGLALDPIDLGAEDDQVFLTIFATGLRGASVVTVTVNGVDVPVRFAGEQGAFLGLDQLDVGPLPASLRGVGETSLEVTADGVLSNAIELSFL